MPGQSCPSNSVGLARWHLHKRVLRTAQIPSRCCATGPSSTASQWIPPIFGTRFPPLWCHSGTSAMHHGLPQSTKTIREHRIHRSQLFAVRATACRRPRGNVCLGASAKTAVRSFPGPARSSTSARMGPLDPRQPATARTNEQYRDNGHRDNGHRDNGPSVMVVARLI